MSKVMRKMIVVLFALVLSFSIGSPSFPSLSTFSHSSDATGTSSFSFFNDFPHKFHALVRFRSRHCEEVKEDPTRLSGMEDVFPKNCEIVHDVLFDLDSTNARATLLHSNVGMNTSYVRRGDIEEDYIFQKICVNDERICKLFCSKSQAAYHLLRDEKTSIPIEVGFPRLLAADLVADEESFSQGVVFGKQVDHWKIQVGLNGQTKRNKSADGENGVDMIGYDLFVRSDAVRVPVRLVSPDGVWDYLEFEIIDRDVEWPEQEVPFNENKLLKKCVWTAKEEGFPRIHLMAEWIMI
jgi:hypothetical protein